MLQPDEVAYLAAQLIEMYRQSWARIQAAQQAVVDEPDAFTRRAALDALRQRVEIIADDLDVQAHAWLITALDQIFDLGAADAAAGMGLSGFASINREAVSILANRLYGDLLTATQYVRASTKVFIREVINSKVTEAVMLGIPALEAARQAQQFMEDSGIHSVVYKNGARVGLDTYAEMAVRTVSAVAYNAGTIHGAASIGVEFFECMDSPDCGWDSHDSDEPADGTIRTGDECIEFPTAHPNCVRAFGPRPDITSQDEADAAMAEGDTGDGEGDSTDMPTDMPTDVPIDQPTDAPTDLPTRGEQRLGNRLTARYDALASRAARLG